MRYRVLALALLTLGVSLLVGGCASQPSRFYLLSALPNTERWRLRERRVSRARPLESARSTLPRYVDRPQIVTRTSPYELNLAEFDRWAESLDANFARVLADNLSFSFPPARVAVSPWPRATPSTTRSSST